MAWQVKINSTKPPGGVIPPVCQHFLVPCGAMSSCPPASRGGEGRGLGVPRRGALWCQGWQRGAVGWEPAAVPSRPSLLKQLAALGAGCSQAWAPCQQPQARKRGRGLGAGDRDGFVSIAGPGAQRLRVPPAACD